MKKLNVIKILIVCALLCIGCNDNAVQKNRLETIDIAGNVKNFKVTNLSTYADTLLYTVLDTAAGSLVANTLWNVYIGEDKVYIMDGDYVKVFDLINGKYLHKIGAKGNGPGELPICSFADVNLKDNIVLLGYSGKILQEYDTTGCWLNTYKPSFENVNPAPRYMSLGKNRYALSCWNSPASTAIVQDTSIIYKQCNKDGDFNRNAVKLFHRTDRFFRFDSRVAAYARTSDTIFYYNENNVSFEPQYYFHYGSYKVIYNGVEYDTKNKIYLLDVPAMSFVEGPDNLFMEFFMDNAPQQFRGTEFDLLGEAREVMVKNVYGIFNKRTGLFHFLLHPLDKLKGMNNDLDHGIPFWPMAISQDGTMIQILYPDDLIEQAAKLDSVPDNLRKTLSNIGEGTNVVVVIAKRKFQA